MQPWERDTMFNAVTSDGKTPLAYATISGALQIVNMLCGSSGVDINQPDRVDEFSWGLQVLSTEGHRGPSQAAIPDSNTTVLGGAVGFGGTGVDGLSGACTALAVGPAPD